MAGSAVSFSGTAKRCAVEDTVIADVGCSGVQIGNSDALDDWNVTALQSEGNSVLRSSISSVGQEFTGCVAVMASATNKSPPLSLPRPPPFYVFLAETLLFEDGTIFPKSASARLHRNYINVPSLTPAI